MTEDNRDPSTMMENIYKIKIRSSPSARDLYPSERRYSSSIVLGLGMMFLALACTSTLMGTLVMRRLTTRTQNETWSEDFNNTNITEEDERLLKKVEEDFSYHLPEAHHINIPAIITAGSFIMSVGQFLAGLAGIFAWKQWYVDHNITWFFLSSCFSSVTSSISLLVVSLALIDTKEKFLEEEPSVSLGLTANIFITSLLGVIWSVTATNVAFRGMKSSYPDDMVLSKSGRRGRVEVSTVKKGNKIATVVPPDILNHFPRTGKLAKFFPRKDSDDDLPKAESNKEYEERVKKFLSGHSDSCSEKN